MYGIAIKNLTLLTLQLLTFSFQNSYLCADMCLGGQVLSKARKFYVLNFESSSINKCEVSQVLHLLYSQDRSKVNPAVSAIYDSLKQIEYTTISFIEIRSIFHRYSITKRANFVENDVGSHDKTTLNR